MSCDERCVVVGVTVGWSDEVVRVDLGRAFVGHFVVDWVE